MKKTNISARSFVLKGDIVHSLNTTELQMAKDAYLACVEGRSCGVFGSLPDEYTGLSMHDYTGHLITPGLIDLHTHAPQYGFRAQGMDLELLDWLHTHTFPAEARFGNLDYASAEYVEFVRALKAGATTRALVFATIHTPATMALMEMLEVSGLCCYVGKVNMDRNAIPELEEQGAQASLEATLEWLAAVETAQFQHTKAILTPRFAPSCSAELLAGLGRIQRERGLAVQSHLSENVSEIEWVRELFPQSSCYGDVYRQSGLFGGEGVPTVMAHCVHSLGEEAELLKECGVWVAHCPESNTCLASGIAPVRKLLSADIRVGLGTDVAGGYSLSMLHAIAETIKMSKLRWRLVDSDDPPLNIAEAFYLATRGGGAFWGKVGSFEPGFEFDAVVFADQDVDRVAVQSAVQNVERSAGQAQAAREPENAENAEAELKAHLERLIYLPEEYSIAAKYVSGRQVL